MIHINRMKEPDVFSSEEFITEKKNMSKAFGGNNLAVEYKPDIKLYKIISKELSVAFNKKCAFCESELKATHLWKVERFRPSINAMNLKGEITSNHYWWLRYDWNNLFLICDDCNLSKGNLFPVKGKRIQPFESIKNEARLLINPCEDNPEDHLLCDFESGLLFSETEMGRITIDVYNLNRSTLKEKRRQEIEKLSNLWDNFIKQLRKKDTKQSGEDSLLDEVEKSLLEIFENNKDEYLLCKRLFLKSKVFDKHNLLDLFHYKHEWSLISNDGNRISNADMKKTFNSYENYLLQTENYNLRKKTKLENYFRKKLTIRRVEISNFNNIGELVIDFPQQKDEKVPWLMILGENSTGKTSILKAIALTLMGNNQRELMNLDARRFLKKGCSKGYVRIFLNNRRTPVELFFESSSPSFKGNVEEAPILLIGYGSIRLLMEDDEELPYQGSLVRCENLFNQKSPLINAEKWLLKLKQSRFKDAGSSLKRLYALNQNYTIYKRSRKNQQTVCTSMFGSGVPINDMSDGYKTITALACDIMMVLQEIWRDSEYAQGIVLIDELDSHLHPRWKMQIIHRLRLVFPKLQFVVTSHEPLTLRGLKEHEIIVLKRSVKGTIYSQADLPSPEGLRVDQLLTSDYFGLNSTIDPETEIAFDRYYQLISREKLEESERLEFESITHILNQYKLLGENQRDRLVYQAIDKFIAKHKDTIEKGKADNIKQETLNKIVSIWEEI